MLCMKKNVLITGITGQDGTFLTKQLLESDLYTIVGTSRGNNHVDFYQRLKYLNLNSEKLDNLKITTSDILKNRDAIESEIKKPQPKWGQKLVAQILFNYRKLLHDIRKFRDIPLLQGCCR